MRFIFCLLVSLTMSEGFVHLCDSSCFNSIEKVLIFVVYIVGITKFTYIIMKEGIEE